MVLPFKTPNPDAGKDGGEDDGDAIGIASLKRSVSRRTRPLASFTMSVTESYGPARTTVLAICSIASSRADARGMRERNSALSVSVTPRPAMLRSSNRVLGGIAVVTPCCVSAVVGPRKSRSTTLRTPAVVAETACRFSARRSNACCASRPEARRTKNMTPVRMERRILSVRPSPVPDP